MLFLSHWLNEITKLPQWFDLVLKKLFTVYCLYRPHNARKFLLHKSFQNKNNLSVGYVSTSALDLDLLTHRHLDYSQVFVHGWSKTMTSHLSHLVDVRIVDISCHISVCPHISLFGPHKELLSSRLFVLSGSNTITWHSSTTLPVFVLRSSRINL